MQIPYKFQGYQNNPYIYMNNGSLCIRGDLMPGLYIVKCQIGFFETNTDTSLVGKYHDISITLSDEPCGQDFRLCDTLRGVTCESLFTTNWSNPNAGMFDRKELILPVYLTQAKYFGGAIFSSSNITVTSENRIWAYYIRG